jgi:hypothetical protein
VVAIIVSDEPLSRETNYRLDVRGVPNLSVTQREGAGSASTATICKNGEIDH